MVVPEACPWWLLVGFGYGLGAMTKQSLRRLQRLATRNFEPTE